MSQVSVFISSCDAYQTCWKPFCYGLRKYWPDCPWPVYFITNYLEPPCGKSLKVGEEKGWSTTQRKALEQIPTEVVLFVLDDYWIAKKVDTKSMVQFADLIVSKKVDRVHLSNFLDEKKTVTPSNIDKRLNGYTKDSKYRTSLQIGLWRVSTFLDLLRDGESPWEFETKGSVRSQNSPYTFLNVKEHRYIFYTALANSHCGAVEKGEWTNMARNYAAKEGIQIDFEKRPGGQNEYL